MGSKIYSSLILFFSSWFCQTKQDKKNSLIFFIFQGSTIDILKFIMSIFRFCLHFFWPSKKMVSNFNYNTNTLVTIFWVPCDVLSMKEKYINCCNWAIRLIFLTFISVFRLRIYHVHCTSFFTSIFMRVICGFPVRKLYQHHQVPVPKNVLINSTKDLTDLLRRFWVSQIYFFNFGNFIYNAKQQPPMKRRTTNYT